VTPTDKQWRAEVEAALYVLAREQLNQSGDKPRLRVVLERFTPKQPSEQKESVPA
jgi:hypothetical protein